MKIKEIIYFKLKRIYPDGPEKLIELIGKAVRPEIRDIVNIFYKELLDLPETAPILEK